jgi:TonB family protein
MPGPDPSPALPNATGVLRGQTADPAFEADFAALAARFAAQSGGGLSAELSADLALEIVLNEIVEQACLATGATGAAIVLQRNSESGREMVCRASTGETAPELGARLQGASGLSGECVRTHQTQNCDDVLADQRVDLEASARLGVRSVMVMPLLRGEELVGVFELFSSLPGAFGERDERTLEALSGRILSNLALSTKEIGVEESSVPELPPVSVSLPMPAQSVAPVNTPHIAKSVAPNVAPNIPLPAVLAAPEIPQPSFAQMSSAPSDRGFDFATAFLGVAVVICALLLGVALDRHFSFQQRTVRRHAIPVSNSSLTTVSAASPAPTPVVSPLKDVTITAPSPIVASSTSASPAVVPSSPTPPASRAASDSIPAGSLTVYENGREVFRQSPAHAASAAPPATGMQPASSLETETIATLSPAMAEGRIVHRVEPEYPESARQMQLQGPVVLDVRIRPDGGVQEMTLVSGQPPKKAVQQWRFKPRLVNGHPASMQTRITLNFRLPQ